MAKAKPQKDHLGKEYPSLSAMCKAYPVKDATTYYSRMKKPGMTK